MGWRDNGLLELRFGPLRLSSLCQRHAEMIVGLRGVRIDLNRVPEGLNRLLSSALRHRSKADADRLD